MSELCLQARDLTAGYGATAVVRDLNLAIRRGEVVALLGPNGAGKTTTLLTLAGELAPLGGEVLLNGKTCTAPLHKRARAGLGLITEQKTILMKLTVAENLRVNRGDSDQALTLFPELKGHLKRQAGLLSGGQQQMLSLAKALTRPTTVILADELSLGLAPAIVARLLAAIRAAADEGKGVLLVEQHIHKALQIADRAVVMRRGLIELDGAAAEFRKDPEAVRRAYLTVDVQQQSAPAVPDLP